MMFWYIASITWFQIAFILAYKLDTSVSANSDNIDGLIDDGWIAESELTDPLLTDLQFDSKKHANKYFDDRIKGPLQRELLKDDLNIDAKKQREDYMKDRMIVIQSSDDTSNEQLADDANKYFDERIMGSRQRNLLSTE